MPRLLRAATRLGSLLADPRSALILSALVLETIALFLWPALYLGNVTVEKAGLEVMFTQRYPFVTPLLHALKGVVDQLFPGALWRWEYVIAFVFECVIAAYVVYAFAAWRLAPPADGKGRPWIGLEWVLLPLLIFQVTLVFLPATMTTDIYNYAIYGEMPVLYGANPFTHSPNQFPQSPLYYLIPLYWHDAPSVYGPLWVDISVGVASALRSMSLADELLAYRLIANVAHTVNTWLVWRIAQRVRPEHALSAALVYGWNPLLLVDFACNGHNDVLMLTFALAGLLLASRQQQALGAIGLGLSIATKYTSVLIAPMLLVWGAQRPGSSGWFLRRVRFGALAARAAIVSLVVVLLYVPWIEGTDTFGPVLYWMTGPRVNNFWPEPILMTVTTFFAQMLNQDWTDTWNVVFGAFKLAAKVGLVALVFVECLRVRLFQDVLASSARVFIYFLLVVNTWIMPWYFAWPLAFAAALGWRDPLVRVSAGLTLTAMIVMYQRQWGPMMVNERAGIFLVLPILLALVPDVLRLARRLLPSHARAGQPSWEARPVR